MELTTEGTPSDGLTSVKVVPSSSSISTAISRAYLPLQSFPVMRRCAGVHAFAAPFTIGSRI